MKKRMFFTLLGCLIVFGGVFGFKAYVSYQVDQAMSQRSAPVQTISATEAVADTWRPALTAVGSTSAVRGVDITSETTGRITAVEVDDGASVEAGDILVELDSDGLQADLRGARAEARLAEIELERQRRLRAQNANSESDVDRAESELEQARSRVDGVQATLDKKTIRAPFSGRLGILEIEEGQYISAGVMIATLQTLNPIEVDFTVPQQELARIETGQTVTATADAFPDREFTGRIRAISPKVERSTRSVAVRGRVENPDGLLRPGMFVRTSVRFEEESDVITLPQTAITYNPYGDSVFLVNETESDEGETVKTVERKFVRTGETRGDQVQILEGVEEGQTVVTSGQLKLRNGSRVEIDNSIEPTNDPSPEVGNS